MDIDQPIEHALGLRREGQIGSAPVACRLAARDQPLPHQSVDKSYGAVVTDEEAIGDVADGGLLLAAPAQREQRLVLLAGESLLLRRALAEVQEAAQRVAEAGDALVVDIAELVRGHGGRGCDHIVIRHI